MKASPKPTSKGAEEARQQLPAILAAAAGRTTIITRHGRAVADADGELVLAVSTVTIAEVPTGPLKAGEEVLAKRYRAVLEAWPVVDFTADIAESAARLRGTYGLKLPDAIQVASALAINADPLVTHDRGLSKGRGLRVLV